MDGELIVLIVGVVVGIAISLLLRAGPRQLRRWRRRRDERARAVADDAARHEAHAERLRRAAATEYGARRKNGPSR